MSEFSVEPSKISYLGEKFGYVGQSELSLKEKIEGDARADKIIEAWAKTDTERSFLEALAHGHEIAEARRISGLSRGKADGLLRRIRGG